MKKIILSLFFLTFLAGCTTTQTAPTQESVANNVVNEISDQDLTGTKDVVNSIIGKQLSNQASKFQLFANGKLTGSIAGNPMTGTWSIKDGYFCRDIFIGEKKINSDCQVVRKTPNGVQFIRNKGTGETADYTLSS